MVLVFFVNVNPTSRGDFCLDRDINVATKLEFGHEIGVV